MYMLDFINWSFCALFCGTNIHWHQNDDLFFYFIKIDARFEIDNKDNKLISNNVFVFAIRLKKNYKYAQYIYFEIGCVSN